MKKVSIEKSIQRSIYIHDVDLRQPGGNRNYPVFDCIHSILWNPMMFYWVGTNVPQNSTL